MSKRLIGLVVRSYGLSGSGPVALSRERRSISQLSTMMIDPPKCDLGKKDVDIR